MLMKMTQHAQKDRYARMMGIISERGIGEVLYERYNPERDHFHILTDTGIVIIADSRKKIIITAYHANFKQAKWIANGNKLPNYLQKIIISNKGKD
jgi:hypothetical protein